MLHEKEELSSKTAELIEMKQKMKQHEMCLKIDIISTR